MAWTKTYTGDEPQRINKWLAQAGVCSRREAETLIADGHVRVNDKVVTDPGHKIAPGQTLTLDDQARAAPLSVVIHKPVGIVSAQPEGDQIPAVRLLTKDALWGEADVMPGRQHKLAPVGRLDQDSHGLLILSEDGVLAKAVIGPQSELDKEYLVRVTGAINAKKLALLRHGLTMDGRTLKPAKVTQIGDQRLRFILKEGRNRQIRRMAEAVDLHVTDLKRVRIGPLELGELPERRWRMLTSEERAAMIAKS